MGQDTRRLSLNEVAQAFDGRYACRTPDSLGGCSSVIELVAADASSLTVRETGLNTISELIDAPLSRGVRQLAIYSRYADLFSALEVQRARGGFRYLKHHETATGRYNPAAGALCSQFGSVQEGLSGLEFFFSNTTLADTSADEPLDPALEEELRHFMADVMLDSDFRWYFANDPADMAELDVLTGAREYCVSYSGSVVDGQIELRSMAGSSGEIVFPAMNDVLEMRTAFDRAVLTAD